MEPTPGMGISLRSADEPRKNKGFFKNLFKKERDQEAPSEKDQKTSIARVSDQGQSALSKKEDPRTAQKEKTTPPKPRINASNPFSMLTQQFPNAAELKAQEQKAAKLKRRSLSPQPQQTRDALSQPAQIDSIPPIENPETGAVIQANGKLNKDRLKPLYHFLSKQEGSNHAAPGYYPYLIGETQLQWMSIPAKPTEESERQHSFALRDILKKILQAHEEGFTEFTAADGSIKTVDELLTLLLEHEQSKKSILISSITLLRIWRQIFLNSKIPNTEIRLLKRLDPAIQAILTPDSPHFTNAGALRDYFKEALAAAEAVQKALAPLQPSTEDGISRYLSRIEEKATRKSLEKSLETNDLDKIVNHLAQTQLIAWQDLKQKLPQALADVTKQGHAVLTQRGDITRQFERDKIALAALPAEPKHYLPFEELIPNVGDVLIKKTN